MIDLVLISLVALVSLFCGALVYLSKNIVLKVRVYFSIALLCMVEWVVTLYLSNLAGGLTLFYNRVVYVGPLLALLFFGLFIDAAYFQTKPFKKLNFASILFTALVTPIALTRLNVTGVRQRFTDGVSDGYSIIPGSLSVSVAVALFILSATLVVRLYAAYKQATPKERRPLRIIFYALSLMISVSLLTDVVIPLLGYGSGLTNLISNLTAIVFITSMAYSVLKYSFLNVKLLVLRSLGYAAGLVVIVSLVGFLQIMLFNIIGGNSYTLNGQERALFLSLVVLASLSFGPLRLLFTKLTSGLFFKDVYSPSQFISSFNSNLVNKIEVKDLLETSMQLLEQTLKASFCVTTIYRTATTPGYSFANPQAVHMGEHDEYLLNEGIRRAADTVIVANTPRKDQTRTTLLDCFDRYKIGAVVKLGNQSDGIIGLMLLGLKKNGDLYNETDVNTLTVIANEMTLAIQNALRFEEIERFNETLQQKVEDATSHLRRANDKLRKLDETKDDFISMASHQLRTPLTSVKGYVSMVLDGDGGKLTPMQRKLLNQSFVSAQRMVYLISDLLNVSRLRTGKFVIEASPVNLAQLVSDEVKQLVETAKGRDLELVYDKPEHFPTLMLDDTKMRQVVMNFLDNAIYYTPRGGKIEARLIDKPQTVELLVTDNGIGVPRAEQPHLFTKFYRAHNAKRARPDGTGLGLFMAKKVVIAQGGAIIFKSTEGKGSTFGFTFAKSKLAQVSGGEKPTE